VLLAVLALALIDWNSMKGPLERFATTKSGRTVKISGPLEVHVWSLTPKASMQGLTIGNPPWEPAKPMVKIERLNVQLKLLPLLKGDVILPRVEIVRPDVYLHREASGRANWTFENTKPTNAKADEPPNLPVVRDFLIEDGKLTIHDELLHLEVNGTVQAHEKGAKDDPTAFRIQGKGTLNKEPFSMRVAGGPLVNLDPDHPYPFDLALDAGDIHVTSDGQVRKPFDLGKLTFSVSASGEDLANLFYLTQLALPNTPPFKLSAHIDRNEKFIKVTNIDGTVGQSDLQGNVDVDASRKRPSITGTLTSRQLRLKDLAASFGGKTKSEGTLARATEPAKPSKKGAEEKAPANAKLFPDARLQVERVRAMDGDVKFSAQSIQAGSVPFKQVAFHIKLDDGLLALTPVEFTLPQGKIEGTVNIDARGKKPLTKVDLRARNVQLDQIKGKAPDAKPPLGGVMQARAVLEGHGDSVHDVMADADGRVSIVVPHGQVNAAFAELTGINVARGIGLLLKGDDERAEIRCGIAQFKVKDGLMTADNVVFDTADVRITGRGDIKLGPEELDLEIKGQPKKLRLARLRTPIEINGHLRKPSIGIDTGKTMKQGAIAAALGAALTPLAAIVAFVDPGLAKDENCGALLTNSGSPSTKASASP
jgi:uncharacterized protein involved in outer membrane biogenesis